MKIGRIVAFTLGALVAVAAVIAAIAFFVFDAERVKAQIAQAVKEKKQRTLVIDGDLKLSFWPSLGVALEGARLSEHASEKEFASVGRAHVSVAVLPLLRGEFVVDKLEVDGLSARVVRDRAGRLNIADLLEKDDTPSREVRFDIAAVRLTNGQLAFVDQAPGRTLSLSGVDLKTGRLGNAARDRLELAANVVSSAPAGKLALRIAGEYDYDLAQKRYAVQGLDLAARGDVAGLQGADLAVKAAVLRADAGGALDVERLAASARGKLGEETYALQLDAPRLQGGGEKLGGGAISAQLKLAGPTRQVDAKLTGSDLARAGDAFSLSGVRLDLDARQGEAALKGTLSSPFSMKAQRIELPQLAGELDVAHPQMPMKSLKLPISGRARADLAKGRADVDLATRFDESSVKAKVELPRFDPLTFAFDVDVDRLNLDRYLPPEKPGKEKAPEKPFDFGALKDLRATGSLRVGSLQVSQVKASQVRLQLKAEDGRVQVSPIAANLYQGALDGSVALDARSNQVKLRQSLSGVQINPLMRDAIDKDLIEGRGNLSLDVAASGGTPGAMLRSLSGTGRVLLRDGAIKGINLAKAFRQVKAALSVGEDRVQQASGSEKTDFSELSASLRIKDGVAHNEDLSVKSPFLRVSGSGAIDVAGGSMNYLAKAAVVGTPAGQEGKELAELKGLTVPVRVTGPFENLSYRIEVAQLASEMAKAKVEQKVESVRRDVEEKARERLQEGLRGLFK